MDGNSEIQIALFFSVLSCFRIRFGGFIIHTSRDSWLIHFWNVVCCRDVRSFLFFSFFFFGRLNLFVESMYNVLKSDVRNK